MASSHCLFSQVLRVKDNHSAMCVQGIELYTFWYLGNRRKIILFRFGVLISLKMPNRKNDLILIMTPEKQDKTLDLSKHWSVDSTPARNEVIMKRTYPVKSVKCDKICSNY